MGHSSPPSTDNCTQNHLVQRCIFPTWEGVAPNAIDRLIEGYVSPASYPKVGTPSPGLRMRSDWGWTWAEPTSSLSLNPWPYPTSVSPLQVFPKITTSINHLHKGIPISGSVSREPNLKQMWLRRKNYWKNLVWDWAFTSQMILVKLFNFFGPHSFYGFIKPVYIGLIMWPTNRMVKKMP